MAIRGATTFPIRNPFLGPLIGQGISDAPPPRGGDFDRSEKSGRMVVVVRTMHGVAHSLGLGVNHSLDWKDRPQGEAQITKYSVPAAPDFEGDSRP